jgi:hypothetical protein
VPSPDYDLILVTPLCRQYKLLSASGFKKIRGAKLIWGKYAAIKRPIAGPGAIEGSY